MNVLLALSRAIDAVNEKLSWIADWLVFLSCLISAGNAFSRYAFSLSSNAWLEIQWYMFGALVMLGASYTLKKNEHVRVDIVYSNLSTRKQIQVDIFGGILFLLPAALILTYLSWPVFYNSWVEGRRVLRQRRRPDPLADQDFPPDRIRVAQPAGLFRADQAFRNAHRPYEGGFALREAPAVNNDREEAAA
jgi:TRAP-type mannitol/chloroaromatic compound transport system permease small subunit